MKKINIFNAESVVEATDNANPFLHSFEIEGTDDMDASDGYHTFDELYDHRITLFITLCGVQRLRSTITSLIEAKENEMRERLPDVLHTYGAFLINNPEAGPLERRAEKFRLTEYLFPTPKQ